MLLPLRTLCGIQQVGMFLGLEEKIFGIRVHTPLTINIFKYALVIRVGSVAFKTRFCSSLLLPYSATRSSLYIMLPDVSVFCASTFSGPDHVISALH